MPATIQILEEAAAVLDECVQALGTSFPTPDCVPHAGHFVFRYGMHTDLLLLYLKAVKIASAANAAVSLIRAGFAVETYALCRMMDEAGEDIWFMATPLGKEGQASDDQKRFFKEFFQEEFENPENLLSVTKRHRVPRRKIHAALSRMGGSNPSLHQAIAETLHQTFSGFVHGAYVHIMEMFGGDPPQFHTKGMFGTPRLAECVNNQASYLYRSIMAIELVARRAQRGDVIQRIWSYGIEFATKTGTLTPEQIERSKSRGASESAPPE